MLTRWLCPSGLLLSTVVVSAPAAGAGEPEKNSAPLKYSESEITAAGVDIVGLRLGMTVEEVRAVLKDRPKLKVSEEKAAIFFSEPEKKAPNGMGGFVTRFPAENHVRTLEAVGDNGREQIRVRFTPSTGEERVMLVSRLLNLPDKSMFDSTRQAVLDKYGAPTGQRSDGLTDTFWWLFGKHKSDRCNREALLVDGNKHSWTVSKKDLASIDFTLKECGAAYLRIGVFRGSVFPASVNAQLVSLAMAVAPTQQAIERGQATLEQEEKDRISKAKSAPKPDL